jgi:hypothetical protein
MHWTMLLRIHFIMCNQICGAQDPTRIRPMLCHGWILGSLLCEYCLFKCALICRLMSGFPHYFDYSYVPSKPFGCSSIIGKYSLWKSGHIVLTQIGTDNSYMHHMYNGAWKINWGMEGHIDSQGNLLVSISLLFK